MGGFSRKKRTGAGKGINPSAFYSCRERMRGWRSGLEGTNPNLDAFPAPSIKARRKVQEKYWSTM